MMPPPSFSRLLALNFLTVASPSTRGELRGSIIRDSGSGIDRNITAEGYLKKKGEQNPIWKRRFFYLKDHVLYYYEDQRKQKLLGQINLHDALLIRTSPPSSHLAQALSIWRYHVSSFPCRLSILAPIVTFRSIFRSAPTTFMLRPSMMCAIGSSTYPTVRRL